MVLRDFHLEVGYKGHASESALLITESNKSVLTKISSLQARLWVNFGGKAFVFPSSGSLKAGLLVVGMLFQSMFLSNHSNSGVGA